MWTGTQWTGNLAANQSLTWFTFNWPATWHVVWHVMPTTVSTNRELDWSVTVERTDPNNTTYWITVNNHDSQPVSFEGRFAVMSP